MSRSRYYMINRPPGIGCQPKGEIARETWMPGRTMPGTKDRRVLGWVEYDQPLTHREIWRFELAPADLKEQAEHVFWNEGRGEDAEWLKNDYLSQPLADIKRLFNEWGDAKAWAALVLLGEITE